ncbi:MAG: hypothetical protein CVU53_06580, partial [Deltaproteobacteria bacterium HGW-Deltaproteobacteria-11]
PKHYYYPNGLLKTFQDPKGQLSTYTYDKANRLLEVAHADGKATTYTYNELGFLTGYVADGISTTYTYDNLGRKLSETVDYGVFQKTFRYSYDARGNKAGYTSPEGLEHTYAYRKNDQLASVTVDGKVFSVAYDKYRPIKLTSPDGIETTFTYNANDRLTGLTTSGPSGALLERHYNYDNVGILQSRSTEHGDYRYAYDDLYRLTTADRPTSANEAFTYDKLGNRLSSLATTGTWTYNANSELILNSQAEYEYDANGNTFKKIQNGQITLYEYNARDQLEKIYLPDGRIATYGYDPAGRRIRKQVGNTVTYYVYADEGLVGEYDATGTLLRSYGWQPDSLWGTSPLYLAEDGQFYFYHNDRQGTPQRLTDINGQVVWSASYSAFGQAFVDPNSTIENNLRFPGQYYDAETDLHYNLHRYYEPTTGRYLSTDPAGDGLNPYVYVSGNPLNAIDPLGLFSVSDALKGISSGLGAVNGFLQQIDPLTLAKSALAEIIGQLECAEPSNWYTQMIVTNNLLLARAIYGMLNGPEALADEFADLFENPSWWNIPIFGGIAQASKAYADNPTYENAVDFAGKAVGALAFFYGAYKLTGNVGGAAVVEGGAKSVTSVTNDFFAGTKYTDKVFKQMKQGDWHSFPRSVEGFQSAGKVTKITGGDGVAREMLKIPGKYKP